MPTFLIYSSAHCGYCVAAKNLLVSRGFDYDERRVDQDPALREEMLTRARQRSVPQIFLGDRHIGGYSELAALDRSGELKQLLEPG